MDAPAAPKVPARLQELKLRYYELMVQIHEEKDDLLEICHWSPDLSSPAGASPIRPASGARGGGRHGGRGAVGDVRGLGAWPFSRFSKR